MECHRCQYNGKADNHCLACIDTLNNPNNQGVSLVSFEALEKVRSIDDMVDKSSAFILQAKPWEVAIMHEEVENKENGFLAVPMIIEQACRKLLAVFSQLTDTEIRTVLDLNRNMTLEEVGKERGTSRQAVHERIKRIVKKHSEFSFLLPSIARLNKKTCTNAQTGKDESKQKGNR